MPARRRWAALRHRQAGPPPPRRGGELVEVVVATAPATFGRLTSGFGGCGSITLLSSSSPIGFRFAIEACSSLMRSGLVPGSGFGQKPNTFHYRATNLVTPTDKMVDVLDSLRDFNTRFFNKYS